MFIKIVKSQRGFGFFGMMVLVIVLAVLGSVVMVTIDTSVSNQAMQETISKMERLQKAIAKYKADNPQLVASTIPATLANLVTDVAGVGACERDPTAATSRMRRWCGPYIEAQVSNDATDYATDGWGTTITWTPGTGTLRSFGPNKVDNGGGTDDIERTGL